MNKPIMKRWVSFIIVIFIAVACQIKTKENKLNDMEAFNINELTQFAICEIKKFSELHPDETFYGFSIDADLLCLNSLEEFEKTLKKYQESYGGYETEDKIKDLKLNTGDWKYQGFAKFDDSVGFNWESYLDHYHLDDEEQYDTDYAKAMDEIVKRLIKSDAFDKLKKTDNFFINRVEHNY